MNEKKYSVLMSVYHKEKPEHLRASIDSMLRQTVKPEEVLLVKDGPLTVELEQIIDSFRGNDAFTILALPENVGLGKALNIGLSKCRNEFVVRMDTDDISKPDRCEKQLLLLNQHHKISVVGSAVGEFMQDPSKIIAYRDVPDNHQSIAKRMKSRNPMNHMSVMFRKSHVIEAGNYQSCDLSEDYFLWIRMLEKGFTFFNINEPLVLARIADESYARRGGLKYFLAQKNLFDYMQTSKMINIFEYARSIVVGFVARVMLPNKMRKAMYLKLLRENHLDE